MKEKRYNFRGHRIKPKYDEEKPRKKEHEKREIDLSFFWWLIPAIGFLLSIFLIFPMLIGTIDILDNTTIEGTYTIEIYIPDCDNGELFFRESGVSGQYLYDNDLGERRTLGNNELKPVSNYQRWERYVIKKFGKSIPNNNCCVEFIKE